MSLTRLDVRFLATCLLGVALCLSACGGDAPADDAGPRADALQPDGPQPDAPPDAPSDGPVDGALVDAPPAPSGADFYFEALGIVDNGPPLFIIVSKQAYDLNGCTPLDGPPVPPEVLPAGFSIDAGDPSNTSYRFDGPTPDGTAALIADGFTNNNALDQVC